ncbi:hypothetical protein LSAT2_027603 [Lamellibrachia satsuma]|nr:hypothetical protein LSAT2_027603 [Lamellibrachia satsuma]
MATVTAPPPSTKTVSAQTRPPPMEPVPKKRKTTWPSATCQQCDSSFNRRSTLKRHVVDGRCMRLLTRFVEEEELDALVKYIEGDVAPPSTSSKKRSAEIVI